MTNRLGGEPTDSFLKDDARESAGRLYFRGFGMWMVGIVDIPGRALEQEIHRLLDRLPHDQGVWRDLTSQYDVDLCLGLFLDGVNQSYGLTSLPLRRLGERGIGVEFDIFRADTHDWSRGGSGGNPCSAR